MKYLGPLCMLALAALFAPLAVARADEPATVRVGVVGSMTESLFYIADKKGYFRDEGITAEFTPFDSAAHMVAPLGAGQLDIGGGAPSAGLFNAVGRGIDVRIVADLGTDTPGYGFQQLIVRSELVSGGRFKSMRDLRGLTVSVAGEGATAYAALNRLLKQGGLTYADVKLVYMGYSDQVVALRTGAVDAALMPEPNATLAVRTGVAVKIAGDDTFYPNQQVAVVLFGKSLLHDRRDVGLRVMRAYLRAVRFYNGALAGGKLAGPNAEDVIKIITENTRLKDPALFRAVTPNGDNPNGHVNLASLRDDFAVYKAQGLIQGNVKPEDSVDDSFVAEALKTLGPYRGPRG